MQTNMRPLVFLSLILVILISPVCAELTISCDTDDIYPGSIVSWSGNTARLSFGWKTSGTTNAYAFGAATYASSGEWVVPNPYPTDFLNAYNYQYVSLQVYVEKYDGAFTKPKIWSNSQVHTYPPPPSASFNASPLSGTSPLTVTFTDTSTHTPTSWAWDIWDSTGTYNYTASTQTTNFTLPTGTWTAQLTVTNAYGSDSELKPNYITVTPGPPIADFSASPRFGSLPLTVTFTDESFGNVTSWDWRIWHESGQFGLDASTETTTFTFNTGGYYNVSLTVSSEYGSDTLTREDYISVGSDTYSYPVTITDSTTGNAISNSTLSASKIVDGSETNHYNATSATGTFILTGYGPTMAIPIATGDIIGLFGSAEGYQENGWSIIASSTNNQDMQIIPLAPNSVIPKTGEFSAVIMAYDGDTSIGISGATITVSKDVYSQTNYTLTGGVATFKNMTAMEVYTATVSASGYTTTSKAFTGSSGEIKYIDIPMSASGVNPPTTITYPVTITDATTGNAISNSMLNASKIVNGLETHHHNATSATGEFTLTGYGPTMAIPIAVGDIIGLFGRAEGYQENGWSIIASSTNNGVTQIIPLSPNSVIPKTGEFSAIIMAYDGDTSIGISGAKITVSNNDYWQSKYTLTGGVATFENMTAMEDYTATVSASGYTTTSKTFTGSSGEIKYIDIPMSASGVNPPTTITYPVTITDAITGFTISNSNLSASKIVGVSETNHYNATSATGKFTLTGYGPTMAIPIAVGDVIGLFGNAEGYQENGWSIIVSSTNNGVTQIIPLSPNSVIPKTGEFSAVIMAYDGGTSTGISGAKITVSNSLYSQSKYTITGGVATFKNMTAMEVYTATVSVSGYSTTSKTFTGSSGEIKYVDIPMSPSGVNPNPTVTVTVTTTGTGTYGPTASDDDLALWIRSKATSILDFLYLFIILGLIGTILRIFKLV
jgi:PKD repeat protein